MPQPCGWAPYNDGGGSCHRRDVAWPGVTGAIVGARNPDLVDGWLDATTLELGREDLDEIAAAIVTTGAGSVPALPK